MTLWLRTSTLEKEMFKKIGMLSILLFLFLYPRTSISNEFTQLQMFNPYGISLKMNIKCDHTKNGYKFYKTVIIKRHDSVTIKVPNNLKKCEVWPVDIKMFGDF